MDSRNRITRITEWEVGAVYRHNHHGRQYGRWKCISKEMDNVVILKNLDGGRESALRNWQGKFEKIEDEAADKNEGSGPFGPNDAFSLSHCYDKTMVVDVFRGDVIIHPVSQKPLPTVMVRFSDSVRLYRFAPCYADGQKIEVGDVVERSIFIRKPKF